MRITLNELRNLVKNILKENIQFPNKGENLNTDALETQIINYVKDNIKIYSVSKNEYVKPQRLRAIITSNPSKESTILFISEGEGLQGNQIVIITNEGKPTFRVVGSTEKVRNYRKFFETKQNLIFIANLIYDITKFIENYYDFPMDISKESIVNKLIEELGFNKDTTDYIKGATDAMGSSEFRRGGGKSYGKKDMPFKSKFGNEPAEEPVTSSGGKTYANYNEWIDSVENISIKNKIEAWHELVVDEEMTEDKFNQKIEGLLNTSLNEIRKLIKNILKEEETSNKTYDNYKEWIDSVDSGDKKAIDFFYKKVKKGEISKVQFNIRVKQILTSENEN